MFLTKRMQVCQVCIYRFRRFEKAHMQKKKVHNDKHFFALRNSIYFNPILFKIKKAGHNLYCLFAYFRSR